MSVVLLGMEMPTQGWKCPLNGSGVCKLKSLSCGKYIPALCPLHPLPDKHGRLIDGDELTERSSWYNLCGHNRSIHGVQDYEIASMETIIESEGDN